MKFIKNNFLLILILAVGIFLRLYQLGSNPYGLFCDEASIGYDAYSLTRTGTDEWGTRWPLFFKAFGEYKSPIMTYSVLPFVSVLGLNDFSTRLPSALWGILGIYAIYFLATTLFNKKIALFSALFLAISPWHIQFSRVSLEGLSPYVCLTSLGVAYWVLYFRHHRLKFGILSSLFLVLATYSYFPARVFVPLLGLVMLLFSGKVLLQHKRHLLMLAVITLILMSPLFYHMVFGNGFSRWEEVKGSNNFITIVNKYTAYFSYDYLFSKGDINFPGQFITRHSIRGMGELYLFQLPLLFFGLIELFHHHWPKLSLVFILFWLFFYPIPDLLTAQIDPYATRSIIGVIPFQIISALGLVFLSRLFSGHRAKTVLISLFIFVFTISFVNYFYLFQQYPQYSSDYWGWQSGPQQIMNYFVSHQSSYQLLCLEGQFNSPDIFLKFYDPNNRCLGKCNICDYHVYDSEQKQLFAISRETYDKLGQQLRFLVLDVIKYPNNEPAFYIGEIHENIK